MSQVLQIEPTFQFQIPAGGLSFQDAAYTAISQIPPMAKKAWHGRFLHQIDITSISNQNHELIPVIEFAVRTRLGIPDNVAVNWTNGQSVTVSHSNGTVSTITINWPTILNFIEMILPFISTLFPAVAPLLAVLIEFLKIILPQPTPTPPTPAPVA